MQIYRSRIIGNKDHKDQCVQQKNHVHIAIRIITLQEVTWVTDVGMLYRTAENELYKLTLKRPNWHFIFYFDCFEDIHTDFLLQSVF